ncbi:hypothetical protein COY52_03745 [Candidatus Desantisbacteria bacterium CG_4_10_14_0_8_um_filter_48_22]|uniref:HEAT repeat domain-containing protein n=1 Tax=Candidatus Desantisbacteria bacterium CG_4_10_14_0_8_um_filter_48_22 TaxID=1974543 RepID=A0A2M7SDI4_9BACT|nr:MAG: hypothetical protein COY52_03745 [Candidatus Desantisbacteria bacterium CG_4_10_14_0_8_um_filter_48_22]
MRIFLLVLVSMLVVSFGYSQGNDVGTIQTNIRAFSGGGKNIKAIDEYRKLFTQTKTHDTELLHRIVMGSLRDEDGYMKMAGAIAVGQLGGSTEAFPFLRDNLKEKDMWIRIWTAVSIGETGDKEAIPNLLYALLNDRVNFVRISSAIALGKLGDASVVSLTDLYIWAVIARSVNDEAIST